MNAKHTTEPYKRGEVKALIGLHSRAADAMSREQMTVTCSDTFTALRWDGVTPVIHAERGQRMADCWNALSGIPDPAEAIKAAREAIGNLFIEIDHMTNGAGFPRKAVMDHARRALALLTHR